MSKVLESVRQPLVSVLLNVRNGENFLSQALVSIDAQSYSHIELVIVDNCSVDDTRELIQKFKFGDHINLKLLKLERLLPLQAARQFGVGSCAGEFIAFIDHDDVWLSNHLERSVGHLENSSHAGCYNARYILGEEKWTYVARLALNGCRILMNQFRPTLSGSIRTHDVIFSSIVVRRKILKDIPFKPYEMIHDFCLYVDLLLSGRFLKRFFVPTVFYRVHGFSQSKKWEGQWPTELDQFAESIHPRNEAVASEIRKLSFKIKDRTV